MHILALQPDLTPRSARQAPQHYGLIVADQQS